jgi:hypothetical protein
VRVELDGTVNCEGNASPKNNERLTGTCCIPVHCDVQRLTAVHMLWLAFIMTLYIDFAKVIRREQTEAIGETN